MSPEPPAGRRRRWPWALAATLTLVFAGLAARAVPTAIHTSRARVALAEDRPFEAARHYVAAARWRGADEPTLLRELSVGIVAATLTNDEPDIAATWIQEAAASSVEPELIAAARAYATSRDRPDDAAYRWGALAIAGDADGLRWLHDALGEPLHRSQMLANAIRQLVRARDPAALAWARRVAAEDVAWPHITQAATAALAELGESIEDGRAAIEVGKRAGQPEEIAPALGRVARRWPELHDEVVAALDGHDDPFHQAELVALGARPLVSSEPGRADPLASARSRRALGAALLARDDPRGLEILVELIEEEPTDLDAEFAQDEAVELLVTRDRADLVRASWLDGALERAASGSNFLNPPQVIEVIGAIGGPDDLPTLWRWLGGQEEDAAAVAASAALTILERERKRAARDG